jgi:predicted membrane protein
MFWPPITAIFSEYLRLADATTAHYMGGDVIYTALEHSSPSLMAFSTNIFICILFLNIFSTLYFKLHVVYLSIGCVILCNVSFKKHLPEYGQNM